MLRSLSSLPWRSSSLSGCNSQPSLPCTWEVMVNWSSFSGRRLPFFSTTLPIEMRPSTGGVIAKPLSMVVLLKMKKGQPRSANCADWPRGGIG
ncbi:hypothetical protein D9M73_298550 [compost metagenome]